MKKKGLIVATIVMVLVLAVSITTATYAWFTTTSTTTIEAFSISVSAGNAVNIGVKASDEYAETVTADDFYYGVVTYAPGTNGALKGSWTGSTTGLSDMIDHNIKWSAQSKAVGISSLGADDTVKANYGTFETKGTTGTFINAANGDNIAALTNVTPAIANIDSSSDPAKNGDYVHLFLGASPAKPLGSNELIILVDGSTSSGTIVGMLAAVHVAYRLNSNGAWTEVDVFGADNTSTEDIVEGKHYSDLLNTVTTNLTTEEAKTYKETYGADAPETKAQAVIIPNLQTEQGKIDQIELVIYIAGTDSDCRNEAKGASGDIKIFFHTTDAA